MDWKKNRWLRTVRRAAAVFICSAIAGITLQQKIDLNTILISAFAAGLLGLEKYIRELVPKETGENTPSKPA